MEKKYAAFLSYSHAADAGLSVVVRDALQQLAKPWHRPRALRVFRDDSSLSANEALWPSIQAAMDASRYFILLASPQAAASPWVAREITHWLSHNPPATLLIVVTGGELHWDSATRDYDRARTTCIPSVLYGRSVEEPRWVDLRGLPPDQLTLHNTTFRDRIADLAAPLHNLAKDDLIGADVQQYQRTRRLVRATIGALATLVVVAGVGAAIAVDRARAAADQRLVAQQQQAEAEQQRALAEQRQHEALARKLLAEADLLSRQGQYPEAARLGLAALNLRDDDETRASLLGYTAGSDIQATLIGHTAAVRGLAYSPDGAVLATSSADHTLRLWDVREPGRPRPLGEPLTAHTDTVFDVQFSPDGRLIATSSTDGVVLWDADDPTRTAPIGDPLTGHDGWVSAVLFAPEQPILATAGLDGQVLLWDVTDPARPEVIGEPLSHDDEVWAAAFSPDGRRLVTAGRDGALVVWDVSDPEAPRSVSRFATTDGTGIRTVAFHPGGELVATGGFRSSVDVWDIGDTGATAPVMTYPFSETVLALAFPPSGEYLVVGGSMPTLTMLELDLDELSLDRVSSPPEAFDSSVQRLRFSPDGRTLAVASGAGPVSLRLGDTAPYPSLSETELVGDLSALSPDGHTLAVIDLNSLSLWDVSDPRQPTRPAGPHSLTTFPRNAVFSPDGTLLATSGNSADDRVRLWDVSDPASIDQRGIAMVAGAEATVAFSPDGRLLGTASAAEGLALWNISNPDDPDGVRLSAADEPARSVAFSPDGRLLAMGSGFARVRLWDISDPKSPEPLGEPLTQHTGPVPAVAFSPDGSVLATGDESGGVILWDLTDPAQPTLLGRAPENLTLEVTTLAFSPDGRVLAASDPLGMFLWEVSYPARPAWLGHWTERRGVAFTRDGHTLVVSARLDDQVRLWDYSRVDDLRSNLTDYACAVAGRGLDQDEWEAALPSIAYHDTCAASS